MARLTDEAYADLLSRFPREELTRVREFLDHIAGRSTPQFPPQAHKGQSPEIPLAHFPGLSAEPFIDTSAFPEAPELEASYEGIRTEAMQLVDGSVQLAQFGDKWKHRDRSEAIGESEWPERKRFVFYNGSTRRDENCRLLPFTSRIIDRLVATYDELDHSAFLIQDGRMRVMPHVDIFNIYVSLWLPIVVPEDCGIEVAGQRRTLEEGQCIAFDNSYYRSTWNNSDRARVVLSIGRVHPRITHTEAVAYKHVTKTYGARFAALRHKADASRLDCGA